MVVTDLGDTPVTAWANSEGSRCTMVPMDKDQIDAGEPESGLNAEDKVFCIQCGYALRGLSSDGNCPECGTPIERSMRGNLLRYSSPDYLDKLHRGVFIILVTTAISFVLTILSIFTTISVTRGGAGATGLDLALTWVTGVVSLVGTWGWWLFSSPDPAYAGRDDGSQARKIVRVTLIINAVAGLVVSLEASLPRLGLVWLEALFGLLALTTFAVSFFAAMLYLRWLTPRIPQERAYKRSKTLMWLGPLLAIVGAPCFLIGPLIVLVLYWNMLDWIRRDLRDLVVVVNAEWADATPTSTR